jgi:hypothetical protein
MMATSAANMIAAMAAKARSEVREHFESANADSPARAVAYEPTGQMHRSQFDALVGTGVLKPTAEGRYWLDREAERAEEETRRARAVLMLKATLIVVAIVVAVAVIVSANG